MRSPGQAPIVFSYGVPRSGGTFLKELLDQGQGYAHRKINEFGPLHPIASENGLLGLMSVVGKNKPIIVRILRHPLEIVESMYALRLPEAGVGGIAKAEDSEIMEWVRWEHANTVAQKRAMEKVGWLERFVEVRYHDFSDEGARDAFIGRLVDLLPDPDFNRAAFRSFIESHWRRHSVRRGRMEMGITESVVPSSRKRWFASQLRGEIEADGWNGGPG